MAVSAGFMVPHPPLIIPEIGKGEQNKIKETVYPLRLADSGDGYL